MRNYLFNIVDTENIIINGDSNWAMQIDGYIFFNFVKIYKIYFFSHLITINMQFLRGSLVSNIKKCGVIICIAPMWVFSMCWGNTLDAPPRPTFGKGTPLGQLFRWR